MNAAAHLQKAIDSEKNGDLAGAMAGYRKVLAREPSNIDALFLLARAHCHQGQLETGAEIFRKLIKLRPDHTPAHTLLGMVLLRLDNAQEALACLERALAADPRSELALVSKADALGALGRHAEALAEYDKALAVNAGNLVTWCNRGTALEALGRDVEAAQSFARAVSLNPNLAEVHFNLANVLLRLQRHDEAAAHYRRALALAPNLDPVHANLGRALLLLGRWREAIDSFERALKLGPGSVQLYANLGQAFWHLQRYRDSLTRYDQALAIDPRHAETLKNKGRLLYLLGRQEEARDLVEKSIALAPADIEAYLDLSQMKRFAPGDPQLTAMERFLPDVDGRPAQEQIALHFALGKAFSDVGDPDRSFHHILKGNALKRAGTSYNEAATIDSFDRIGRVFTSELLRSKVGHGDPSDKPIFIVGMPRSGTTLIEQILASHPQVYGAGERPEFQTALFDAVDAKHYPEVAATMTPAQLDALGTAYLSSMATIVSGAARFTDKMPANFAYVGLIGLALPNARIIHARRDPVDTCFSCFSTNFSEGPPFTHDLGELGRYYRAYERVMEHWRQVLPQDAMLEVQYEDVVADLETQARRIVAYCGLEWDDACLAFHKTERPVRTASAAQVRQPIYRTSIDRWRPYEAQLKPLLDELRHSA